MSLVPDILTGTEVFMKKGGQAFAEAAGGNLKDVSAETRSLRKRVLTDPTEGEVAEYLQAEAEDDLVEVVDGLLDMIVCAWGALLAYVGPEAAKACAAEVTRSNLDKVIGVFDFAAGQWVSLPIKDEGGKIIKPPGWTPPDIAAVLRQYGFDA